MSSAIPKNHMDVLWHDYTTTDEKKVPITEADLIEKSSIVGRCGLMLLSCGTGKLASAQFHEYFVPRVGYHLYSRYRINVD